MTRIECLETIQEGSAAILEAKGALATLDELDAATAVASQAARRAAIASAIATAVITFADVAHVATVSAAAMAAFDASY